MRSNKTTREADLTRTQQARRGDVIRAAITVINRDGYAAASIDRIAKQAGASKSTVLYHFKSKQAINEALIDSIYKLGAAYVKPHISKDGPCRETLQAYLVSNMRFIADHVEHIAAVQKVLQDVAPRDYNKAPLLWLQRLFEKGQANGELGEFDPSIMAGIIRSVVDSVSFFMVANPSFDINLIIEETVRLFDKAVRPD